MTACSNCCNQVPFLPCSLILQPTMINSDGTIIPSFQVLPASSRILEATSYPGRTSTSLPGKPKPTHSSCILPLLLMHLPPPLPHATVNNDATKVDPTQAMQQDAMTPPNIPKPFLKAGKFLPARSTTLPPRQAGLMDIDLGSNEDDHDPSI